MGNYPSGLMRHFRCRLREHTGLIRMSIKPTSVRQRRWLASLLALTFALRALIPAGFMPAGDGSLTLRICPEGFVAALLINSGNHAAHDGHHHEATDHPATVDAQAIGHGDADSSGAPGHDHRSWMSTHCPFGAVASAPPPIQAHALAVLSETQVPLAHPAALPVSFGLRHRIAQPRAPPSHLA